MTRARAITASEVIAPREAPRSLFVSLQISVAIGFVILVAGILGLDPERVWISYLVNFVFWSGLAQGAVAFSAAYRLTNAKWGETIRRVAEGFILFVPLSALLFLVTFVGRHYLWAWIEEPIPEKAAWLNEPFFFIRVTVYYLALSGLSVWYVYRSIRPEVGWLKEKGLVPRSPWIDRITANWRGHDAEVERSKATLTKLVPFLLVGYGVFYSFVGFDVVMSLEPHWFSTLYGWLYFIHAFYASIAATIVVAILARRYFSLHDQVGTSQFYDVGRLLMGISMLSGGFYWSQYLVVWYGNLGEEIERLILRFAEAPWPPFQWSVIVFLYFFPLAIFLSRTVKERPRILFAIALIILVANWFYQFVEIVPSVWKSHQPPLGIIELGMTVGFLGAVGLCWLTYAKIVPLVPMKGDTSNH